MPIRPVENLIGLIVNCVQYIEHFEMSWPILFATDITSNEIPYSSLEKNQTFLT